MNEQPEALRLADVFDKEGYAVFTDDMRKAAAELRRLHDENEALRKDAERYRWLREFYSPECIGRYMTDIDRGWYGDGIDLDDAIDAAMKKGQP